MALPQLAMPAGAPIGSLCRGHHREVHRCGDEAAWWKKAGIDPTSASARSLWRKTHPPPMTPDKMGIEAATPSAAIGADQRNGDRAQSGASHSHAECRVACSAVMA